MQCQPTYEALGKGKFPPLCPVGHVDHAEGHYGTSALQLRHCEEVCTPHILLRELVLEVAVHCVLMGTHRAW